MKAEAKALWIAALRSGVYTQAQGSLRSRDAFCCLGVACDIFKQGEEIWEYGVFKLAAGAVSSHAMFLPECILARMGLEEKAPRLFIRGEWHKLHNLNDGGFTFSQIADLIEEFL